MTTLPVAVPEEYKVPKPISSISDVDPSVGMDIESKVKDAGADIKVGEVPDTEDKDSSQTVKTHIIKNPDGGEVILYKKWLSTVAADALYSFVNTLETRLYPFGIPKNRPIWACGDPGVTHAFRGIKVMINPWPDALRVIRNLIFTRHGIYIKWCLLNEYGDGTVGIAQHADGELTPITNNSVMTLSLGATRQFTLTPASGVSHWYRPVVNALAGLIKSTKAKGTSAKTIEAKVVRVRAERIDFNVEHGDLLVMHGSIQNVVKHGIEPQPEVTKPRKSLTFR
jgi:hypothetical protein